MRKVNTRLVAAELIHTVTEHRKILDDALNLSKQFATLEGADRGFARSIVSSCLRQLGRIDIGIAPFLDRPLEATTPEVRALLRVGATQLWILDNPSHSAVNETVEAARLWQPTKQAGGFVNAVLRKLAINKTTFDGIPPSKVWPNWLYTVLSADLTTNQVATLAEMQQLEPKLHLNVNTDAETVARELQGTLSPVGGVLVANKNPADLPGYRSGQWWVQDMAATLPVKLLAPQENETILDLCAAPGGKTMQFAQTKANVIAVDQSEKRMDVLRQNLKRTNLKANLVISNVAKFKPTQTPVKVLLDAPCSAMGTLRRHPEGAWIKRPDDLIRFPEIQMRLLRATREMCSAGTSIVYSVCTPLKREGKDIINEILSEGGLERDPIKDEEVSILNCRTDADGDVLTIPDSAADPCDVFFMARLKRI